MSFVSMGASASGCHVGKLDFCARLFFDIQLLHVFNVWVQINCIEFNPEVLDNWRTKF